jgi:hypothetical protein
MARAKPKILLQHIEDDLRALEICHADALYCVFYKGHPFKMRNISNIDVPDYPGPKYSRITFPESGHAYRLRDKLNLLFGCSDFTVVLVTNGRTLD